MRVRTRPVGLTFMFPCLRVSRLFIEVYVYRYIATYKARFLFFENLWNANDADRIILFSRSGLENGPDRENPYCSENMAVFVFYLHRYRSNYWQSRLN